MIPIEILVEEKSMEIALKELLPKILPEQYHIDRDVFIRPHQGKTHLKNSVPKKVKVFNNEQLKRAIIVLIDQDNNDCKKLKAEIRKFFENARMPYKIRIVCRELENWYLSDKEALKVHYPDFERKIRSKSINYDNVVGSDYFVSGIKSFSKTKAAREIAPYMNIEKNKNQSFIHFRNGLTELIKEIENIDT